MNNVKLGLCEPELSKIEWLSAFIMLAVPFMSFCYIDTACFIMYELKFAQAILHFNLKEAYEPIVKVMSAAGWEVSSLSVYDLPLNLVFGIWGIPLYLYSTRNGTLEITFTNSFWQMLYGKSILLVAFIISSVLVYKVCRALDINSRRSRWGAYIYFTSAMSVTAVGIIGQCDVFAICLTLLGFLAYIKNENKKFLFWFVIAIQFKQFAFFIFMPLLLLKDKNLLRVVGKTAVAFFVTFLSALPIFFASRDAFKARTGFTAGMTGKLLENKLPMLNGSVSMFLFAFGALCIYCWLHEYKNNTDKKETDVQAVFTALLSMVILFTTFSSYPYWFMHMIPYLSIIAVYKPRITGKILLFETLGIAAVIFANYIGVYWCYTPNNANNMLLSKVFTGSSIPLDHFFSEINKAQSEAQLMNVSVYELLPSDVPMIIAKIVVWLKRLLSLSQTVYVVCMYAIVWLAYPRNCIREDRMRNIRLYVLIRLLFNALVCSVPIILIFLPALRS